MSQKNAYQAAGNALVWKSIQLVAVKGIFMLRLLVLARLLSPDDFGLQAIAVTAIGFLLNVTDLGMTPALIQGQKVDETQYNVAWTVGLTRALLVTTSLVLAAPLVAGLFADLRAVPIIRVLALRPTLDALASIKVARFSRRLQFRSLAIVQLTRALANAVVAIALARPLGAWALVAGVLAGSASFTLISYFLAPHRPRLCFDRAAAGPLIQFGRWILLASLIVMAGSYVLRVLISRQLGATGLGLYFLGAQLGFLPAEIAGGVVGSVAFPFFARLQSDIRQAARAFRTMLIGICIVLIPLCALIIALAPTLVHDLLGDRWAGTIPVIRVLALASLLGTLGEVAVPILKGLGQPHKVTAHEAIQSLTLIIFAWSLVSHHGLVGTALAWLPAMTASQVLAIVFIRQLLRRPFVGLGVPVLGIALCTGVGALVALVLDTFIPGLAGLAVAGPVAIIVTGALLWAADRRFALGLMEAVIRVFPPISKLARVQSGTVSGRGQQQETR